MVRDNLGPLLHLRTHVFKCNSAFEAEARTLEWATDVADDRNWKDVIWSSYAKEVVDEVLGPDNPSEWSTRYTLLRLRRKFACSNWTLQWNARESNSVVDNATKVSLNSRLSFG